MVLGCLMCLPHGLRDMCMTRLGLLALNEYGSGVIDILVGTVFNNWWCIVGRQAVWWERILSLHNMGTTCTSQCFSSLTYHIRDWRIYLIEARWVSWVHFCGDTCSNNCSRVDLHHLFSYSSCLPSLWPFALSWPPYRPSYVPVRPLFHSLL